MLICLHSHWCSHQTTFGHWHNWMLWRQWEGWTTWQSVVMETQSPSCPSGDLTLSSVWLTSPSSTSTALRLVVVVVIIAAAAVVIVIVVVVYVVVVIVLVALDVSWRRFIKNYKCIYASLYYILIYSLILLSSRSCCCCLCRYFCRNELVFCFCILHKVLFKTRQAFIFNVAARKLDW